MRAASARAVLPWLAAVCLVVPPGAAHAGSGTAGGERAGPDAERHAAGDTVTSRADSTRLKVLERIRRNAAPAVDSAAADTTEADTTGAAGPFTAAVPERQDRPPPRTPLPDGADSVMRALAELSGYRVAAYRGARADFEARDRRLILSGTSEDRASFSGQGHRVDADSSITYDDVEGRIRTTGASTFTPSRGDPMESRTLIYDLRQERGTATSARTTYTEGGEWIVEGDLDSVEEGRLFGSHTRFTSCDLEPPHSHFQASELKMVAEQVLVARGVRMYVEDVPIMWLPFMAQNLGSGRASGILTPRFSVNDIVRTSTGYERRLSNVGYYWAMSEYSDLTVAMDWFSGNYTALSTGLRYNWRRQFLQGNADVKHFWRESGRRELAVNTRHSWDISERTRADVSARYVTSSEFVRENSFDPREVTQNIRSDAGFSHRFDWGNLSVSANRNQFLSEDRTDMTLPSVNLSLTTMTLFSAPPGSASWYNNVSLGGGMKFTRDQYDRPAQPDTAFRFSQADELRTRASLNASVGLGDANLGGRLDFTQNEFADVPGALLPGSGGGPAAFSSGDGLPPALDPFLESALQEDPAIHDDFARASATWSANLGYRVNLIGSTTLTPSVGVSGELQRTDSIPEVSSFVSGPARLTTGARLQTDIYGFYPGFGEFDGVRHKITPSASFDYSPAVRPTELQEEVFGARTSHPRKVLTFGFNQTWEARLPEEDEEAEDAPGEAEEEQVENPVDPQEVVPPALQQELDPEAREETTASEVGGPGDDGPRRMPRARVVTLLALNTSSVTYDMVQADSTGEFLRGFQTTRLSNTVRSDYLRGLDLSFEHDLFDDPTGGAGEGEGEGGGRRFAPHLSRLSFGFRVDHRSGVVRALLGLLGVDTEAEDAEEDPEGEPGPGEDEVPAEGARDEAELAEGEPVPGGPDANRIVPGDEGPGAGRRRTEGWDARISYSLRRPRDATPGIRGRSQRAQMIQWTMSFAPTENWDASWNSSYDVEAQRFNDHMVQLRRDLHEWEATFSFRQTATGNWAFQFEVALRANQDLRFDYEQRNRDTGGRRAPLGGQPF